MNIVIAGPIPREGSSGGVAVFNLNLAKQFIRMGHNVTIYTSGKYEKNDLNVNIKNIKEALYIKSNNVDLIISSLWYSAFFLHEKNVIKIHLLHGFTNLKNYSLIKFFFMILFDKLIARRYEIVLSNSEFTRTINEEIFGLNSTGLFQIGLDEDEINNYRCNNEKKEGLLYLGRLVKAKKIDQIIESFILSEYEKRQYNLIIVGHGDQEKALKEISVGKNIMFKGEKSHDEVIKYYRQSKIFISLNPVEPFGITFLEALVSDNFIIAPSTGGQVELLRKFPDRVAFVDVNSLMSIVNAINVGMKSNVKHFFDEYNLNNFTYDKTARDILSAYYEKRKI